MIMQDVTNRKAAVLIGKTLISFSEMEDQVAKAVHWFQSAALTRGAWVGVALQNDYQHWVVTLALLRLGHPCASTYDIEAMPQTLKDRFSHWIVDAPLRTESGWIQPPLDIGFFNAEAQSDPATDGKQNNSAQLFRFHLGAGAKRLILTSGTTGRPKVVGFDVGRIQKRLGALSGNYANEFTASTRFLSFMGLDTVSGFFYGVLTWLRGGTVLFGVPTADGHGKTMFPIRESNVITAAPARLKELADKSSTVWPGCDKRVVMSAGSRLHTSVRDQVQRIIGSRVINTYGSTEAGVVALCDARMLDENPGAAGFLAPGVKVEILDADGVVLPFGQMGRLRCQTPGMVRGYEGEEKSLQFEDGWFYPGDLAVLRDDGWLVVAGRDTDVINLGGLKLSAVDMETKLHDVEGVNDVCVVGLDQQGVQRLAIAVVHEDGVVLEQLRPRISARLPGLMSFHLIRVSGLPRNAMGKLPRPLIAEELLKILSKSSDAMSKK